MMTSSSLVWLLFVATPMHAARVRVSEHSTQTSKDQDYASIEQALQALSPGVTRLDVSAVSEGHAALAKAFLTVQTLLSGLEASLGSNIPASVRGEGTTIIVNPPEQMRGELATKSRVPVQWVIDQGASFTFVVESATSDPDMVGQVSIVCTGFYQSPFDGLSVYAKFPDVATDPATWATASPAGKQAALEREVLTFYRAVDQQRKKPWYGEATYLESPYYLYSVHHKQMRVWNTIREMTGYGLILGESNGKSAMYPLMVSAPKAMNKIVFANYIKQNSTSQLGIRVAFETSLDGHGDKVTMPNGDKMDMTDFYKHFALEEKCNMLFDPDEFPSQRSQVESKAGSAMNFAAAMAAGSPVVCAKNADKQGKPVCIEGGKPDKVIKFMEACLGAPMQTQGWESQDATYECRDSQPGRVVWRRKSVFDRMQ